MGKKLRKMTEYELKLLLEEHERFLNDNRLGTRANLSKVDQLI
jgi:hypothetical protein